MIKEYAISDPDMMKQIRAIAKTETDDRAIYNYAVAWSACTRGGLYARKEPPRVRFEAGAYGLKKCAIVAREPDGGWREIGKLRYNHAMTVCKANFKEVEL